MATSYTSLLGLALPVTGELAGTWGDTVNNAITALLDTAVAGTTTLSTDADVTLTTTSGVANQARQAILLCSGARTALRTITAPAQSKIYVVINKTTGGFGVKLVGVGPTAGVTIAAGKTAVLVWDGADFVEVAPATATTATNLAGGAAGSLPYQSGAGATTFLGIGANNFVLTSNGTAPVWTTNTGTGNVVRATSPTLTTPVLGTPTSGTLTNCTGLPISTGVSGLGANVAAFLATPSSANLAAAVTGETGSGALVFGTSPTLATPTITTSATIPLVIGGTGTTSTLALRSTSGVGATGADIIFQTGNNGATEAMRILNSGDIGVGTASPTSRLSVNGTFNVTGNVTLGDAATDTVAVNGYVGVGIAPATNAAIDARGSASATQASIRGVSAGADTIAAAITITNAAQFWASDSTKGAGSTITNQHGLYIADQTQGTNNFGITSLVSSGANKWNIYASGTAANYFAGNVQFAAGSAAAPALTRFGDDNTGIFFPAADTIAFAEGGVESMRIDSARNVGIGTSSPADRLHVYSATAQDHIIIDGPAAINRTLKYTTAGSQRWALFADGTAESGSDAGSDFRIARYNDSGVYIDPPFFIARSTGNIGIGTTSPVNKLEIDGSLGRNAPVTKTGNFTLAATENWIICNGTGTITVTLPAASSWTGREVMIKTIAAFTVVSASSNVVPLAGGAAGTAILGATAGAWATLVSNGTNWVIMQA